MPYMLVGDCVHKQNADGSAGETVPGGCHKTHAQAVAHLRALEAAMAREREKKTVSAFKVFQDEGGQYRWWGISSNAYRDRDGEIVSAKALAMWTAYAETNKRYGGFDFMHVIDLGEADAVAFHNPWLFATGTFDDTEVGRKAGAYFADYDGELGDLGMSCQFDYIVPDRADKVYDVALITKHTIAPLWAAANPYTTFTTMTKEHNDMANILEEAIRRFQQKAGLSDDELNAALSEADAKKKALDDEGVERKTADETGEHSAPEATEQPVEQTGGEETTDTEADEADEAVKTLISLVQGAVQAEVQKALTDVAATFTQAQQGVEQLGERISALENKTAEQFEDLQSMAPRSTLWEMALASTAEETKVSDDKQKEYPNVPKPDEALKPGMWRDPIFGDMQRGGKPDAAK